MAELGEIHYPDYYLHLDATPESHAARDFIEDVGLQCVTKIYHSRDNPHFPYRVPCLEFMNQKIVIERYSGWMDITQRFPEIQIRQELEELAHSSPRRTRLALMGEV